MYTILLELIFKVTMQNLSKQNSKTTMIFLAEKANNNSPKQKKQRLTNNSNLFRLLKQTLFCVKFQCFFSSQKMQTTTLNQPYPLSFNFSNALEHFFYLKLLYVLLIQILPNKNSLGVGPAGAYRKKIPGKVES